MIKKTKNFRFKIGEHNLENYALPPDDPLGELSAFELGLRRFFHKCDRQVVVEIGERRFTLFFDPDLCMLFEDRFCENIGKLEQGESIRIDFAESELITIKMTPVNEQIYCQLKKFGDEDSEDNYELDKCQVLGELRRLLVTVMEESVSLGYVTLEDQQKFMAPAFIFEL